jgi:hypothetical protein
MVNGSGHNKAAGGAPGVNIRYCPKCKTGTLYERVPRAWWVKAFLFFLPLKRYKCYKCGRKPYLWERQGKQPTEDKGDAKIIPLLFFFLLVMGTTRAQQGYPKVTGYTSFTHPLVTLDNDGATMNFSESYTVIFPVGLNLMKTERFGFSFELSPAIKADKNGARVSSVLFHPGAVFRFDKGFGMAGRLAFDTGGRFGFTTVVNRTLAKKDTHNYWVAVPFPVRFGNGQPASIGAGIQFGIGF